MERKNLPKKKRLSGPADVTKEDYIKDYVDIGSIHSIEGCQEFNTAS
jgi:hypothetical protein